MENKATPKFPSNYIEFEDDHLCIQNKVYNLNDTPPTAISCVENVFKCKAIPIVGLNWRLQIDLCEVGSNNADKEKYASMIVERFETLISCVAVILPHVEIPLDLWNRIAYEFYEPVMYTIPGKWGNDVVTWRNWWLCNSQQQKYLPIYFCNRAHTELMLMVLTNKYASRLFTCTSGITRSTGRTDNTIHENFLRWCDFIMGVHFDDISNIERCSMSFSHFFPETCVHEFPFILTDEYTAKCVITDELETSSLGIIDKFYFHPLFKCFPILSAAFTAVTLNITVKDTTKPNPVWNIIGSCVDTDIRHKYRNNEYLFEDAPYKLFQDVFAEKDYYPPNAGPVVEEAEDNLSEPDFYIENDGQ